MALVLNFVCFSFREHKDLAAVPVMTNWPLCKMNKRQKFNWECIFGFFHSPLPPLITFSSDVGQRFFFLRFPSSAPLPFPPLVFVPEWQQAYSGSEIYQHFLSRRWMAAHRGFFWLLAPEGSESPKTLSLSLSLLLLSLFLSLCSDFLVGHPSLSSYWPPELASTLHVMLSASPCQW